MTNVGIAFQLLKHGDDPPIGYTKASGHLIFDVKMDFTRKSRCNTTIAESTLKKKSQSLCSHFVREGVARDEWRTGYIQSVNNPDDVLTKPLPATKIQHLVKAILHHSYDDDELKKVE